MKQALTLMRFLCSFCVGILCIVAAFAIPNLPLGFATVGVGLGTLNLIAAFGNSKVVLDLFKHVLAFFKDSDVHPRTR